MMYSFVTADGRVVGQPKNFSDLPPELHVEKGRWLLDEKPTYDDRMYVLTRVEPVDQAATTVPYLLTPVDDLVARSVKRQRINEQRMTEIVSGFTYEGKLIDSDHSSAVNILGAALAALIAEQRGEPFSVTWTCADNTSITLNASQMLDMMTRFFVHTNTAYTEAREQKEQL